MNALSNAVNPSIGSRDIAKWVESLHDNMKRAIDAGVLKTREKAA